MAITVQDIGDAALRIIGQMGAPGRGSSPEEQAEYLYEFNNLIDQFQAERLMIFEISRTVYALVSGTGAYTMGPGFSDSWGTTRPARIEALGFVTADPQEEPMKIVSYEEWSAEAILKAAQGSIIKIAWIDYAYPTLIVNVWPVPSVSGLSVAVYAWTALAGNFGSITASVAFPPAYQTLFEYALALVLAPRYKKPIQPSWQASYNSARMTVAKINQVTLPPEQVRSEIPAGDPPPDPSVGAGDAE